LSLKRIESDYATSYQAVIVTLLSPTLPRFWDIAVFLLINWPQPLYSTRIFFLGGCSRWTRSPILGSARAQTLS